MPRKKVNQSISYSVNQFCQGYIALASVLVIAAVVLTISLSASLLSVSEGQMSLAGKKNEEAVDFVEGCVEDALLRLNENDAIPTQIPLPQGNCDVTIDSQSDNNWTFTVSGSVDNYTKRIQVAAERTTQLNISSWLEVE